MSRSEDYLDQLLKGVSPEDQKALEMESDTLEDNIFNDILEEFAQEETPAEESEETELAEDVTLEDWEEDSEDEFGEEDIFGDDFLDDEFLREFELEMERLDASEETGSEEDVLSLFGDLDNILNGEKNQIDEPELKGEATLEEAAPEEISPEEAAPEEDFSEVNFADLFTETNETATVEQQEDEVEIPAVEEGFAFANLFSDDNANSIEDEPQEDADVLKILEGLEGIDLELDEEDGSQSVGEQPDFSALEGFLAASAEDSSATSGESEPEGLDFGTDVEAAVDEQSVEKGKKAGEKTGFMSKLGLILFGEDDEEDDEPVKGKKKGSKAALGEIGAVSIGEASEADLEMLEDITEKSKKEQKKKEKKEKREKAKQEKKEKKEKAKKEKQAKPKKEKKPKQPKEPDNTPPLPKKPVFLMFLMVASLLALILMGADLLGYSNQMTNAKNQYAKKNYSEAFAEISGMEIKEEDLAVYGKYHVMAMVSAELEAYESLMDYEFYDMALDCLVRTIGRAEKYRTDAESYGCIEELNELEAKAEEILNETFGVSKEQTLEFYAYPNKKDYSTALAKIIKELGLEKGTE